MGRGPSVETIATQDSHAHRRKEVLSLAEASLDPRCAAASARWRAKHRFRAKHVAQVRHRPLCRVYSVACCRVACVRCASGRGCSSGDTGTLALTVRSRDAARVHVAVHCHRGGRLLARSPLSTQAGVDLLLHAIDDVVRAPRERVPDRSHLRHVRRRPRARRRAPLPQSRKHPLPAHGHVTWPAVRTPLLPVPSCESILNAVLRRVRCAHGLHGAAQWLQVGVRCAAGY